VGAPALALAWALSVLVLLAPRGVVPDPGSASRTALCLVPWLALGGLPRGGVRPATRETLGAALLLPPLALALVLDVSSAAGHRVAWSAAAWGSTLETALLGLVLFLALQHAARLAAAGPRPHFHGALWLVGVALLPVASAMAAWDGRPGGGPAWLAWAATVSPLEWAHGRLAVGDAGWPRISPVLAPAALVLLLLGVAGRAGDTARQRADQAARDRAGDGPT